MAQLALAMNSCPHLMGLHLSDNGLRLSEPDFKEFLEIFGINFEPCCELEIDPHCEHEFEIT